MGILISDRRKPVLGLIDFSQPFMLGAFSACGKIF
jgi:hypothetical protein